MAGVCASISDKNNSNVHIALDKSAFLISSNAAFERKKMIIETEDSQGRLRKNCLFGYFLKCLLVLQHTTCHVGINGCRNKELNCQFKVT